MTACELFFLDQCVLLQLGFFGFVSYTKIFRTITMTTPLFFLVLEQTPLGPCNEDLRSKCGLCLSLWTATCIVCVIVVRQQQPCQPKVKGAE